jgi:hypothetical protein
MTALIGSAFPMRHATGSLPRDSTTTAVWERYLIAVIALVWLTTVVADFRVAAVVLMTIGLVAAVMGLGYPRLGLLGVGMLCTLNDAVRPFLLMGGWWRHNTLSYWLLFVTVLFSPHLLRGAQWQTRLLVAFVLLLGLEILLSPDPPTGIQDVFVIVALFGLMIYFRRAVPDLEAWYWLGVISGVLAAAGSPAFLLQQATLPYINPNVWSLMPLGAMLAICLAFVVTEQASHRQFVLVILAWINGLWVFLSGSRGNLLIAAVCLIFLLTGMRLRRLLVFGVVAALVSVVVASQFSTLQDSAAARLHLLTDRSQSLTVRTSGRYELALGAWYMFRDHPLGVGTGGFPDAWSQLDPREGMTGWHRYQAISAHSGWMKVLAENGFPGILLLGAYVLSFAVSGWRTRAPVLRRLGLLVTAVLAVAWVSTELESKGLWLLAAGATVFLHRHAIGGASRQVRSIDDG